MREFSAIVALCRFKPRGAQSRAAAAQYGAARPWCSAPRYIGDEPPGTGILGGGRTDLYLILKQPIDAEAARRIRPTRSLRPPRSERSTAALMRVPSLEGLQ